MPLRAVPADRPSRLGARRGDRLAPAAFRSADTRGPCAPEPEDLRTAFERDRDRILHAKAFRRLKHKTQVFIDPDGDHFVTRLTHTLQVTQIARALAEALALNETLAEAIALGHDVGHSPFGHTGEEALSPYFPGGWHHAAQSVRIFEVLEDLNLTWEVRTASGRTAGRSTRRRPPARASASGTPTGSPTSPTTRWTPSGPGCSGPATCPRAPARCSASRAARWSAR